MLLIRSTLSAFLVLLAGLVGLPSLCQGADVRVAVAANFASCLENLAPEFKAVSEHEIVPIVGSTGRHFAQISAGAPFDVFLSADRHHAQKLIDQGHAEGESSFVYAQGKLVFWMRDAQKADLQAILQNPQMKPVAMANPRLAPYGEAARQVLLNLNLSPNLDDRIVMGTSVGQTWQFAATGNCAGAFVSLSQVVTCPTGVVRLVNPNLYQPIEQQAVLLKGAIEVKAAREFLLFLQSKTAQKIIQKNGYGPGKLVP